MLNFDCYRFLLARISYIYLVQCTNNIYKYSICILLLVSFWCNSANAAEVLQENLRCLETAHQNSLDEDFVKTSILFSCSEKSEQFSINNFTGNHNFLLTRLASFQFSSHVNSQKNLAGDNSKLQALNCRHTLSSLEYLKNNSFTDKYYYLSLILFPHHFYW